jgi:hypothetical protein
MIYIFGKDRFLTLHYAPELLNEEQKNRAVKVEQLPLKEERSGYNAILCLNNNNELYWEYEPIVKDTTEETPQE